MDGESFLCIKCVSIDGIYYFKFYNVYFFVLQ